MENKLPKNWVNAKLNDLATIQSGGTPSRSKKEYWSGDIPWVKISDLKEWYVKSTTEFITEEGLNNSSTKVFPKGTILFTIFATIGKVGVLDIEACTNQAIAGITPIENIEHKFLTYSLIELAEILQNEGKGVAQKNINLTILKNLNVPLPPLPEQQRIVAKLDELFGHLDTLKTRLENIPQILKNFRQAVLTQAVTGKLTEEWRKGKELEEWKVELAKDCCEKVQSGGTPKGSNFAESGIPFFKVYNIVNQKISFDYKPQFISEEIQNSQCKKSICFPNDVLMNIVGPPLNKVAMVPEEFPECNINQAITLFRVKEYLNNKYLYYFLCEGSPVNKLVNETKGVVGQVNISLTQCREFEISIPPLEEQTEIVKRVEHLFAKADAIEAQYQSLKTKIDSLPQAVLAKAFKGELVEQLDTDLPAEIKNTYYAYVLYCINGSLYIGFTNNLKKRYKEHQEGIGAEHTKKYKPLYVYNYEVFDTEEKAIKREKFFKSGKGREWLQKQKPDQLRQAGGNAKDLLEEIKRLRESSKKKTVKKK